MITGVNEAKRTAASSQTSQTTTGAAARKSSKKKSLDKKLEKLDAVSQIEGNQQMGKHLKKAAKLRRKKQRRAGA